VTFLDRMDPEIAAVFAALPPLDLSDLPRARREREELAALRRAETPPDPAVARRDHVVPGLPGEPDVRVRHYRPAAAPTDEPLPCLYWIHGGGHLLGTLDQDDPLMEHIVATVGCACVSVDWRRAPEHPFPAEINDCYAGLRWAVTGAERLGIDPTRVAVGGASSGGGSAAGLALMARDRGELPVRFQLLIYPMLDDRNVTPSSRLIEHPNLWGRRKNVVAWAAYLGAGAHDVSPYAAPTRATDLTGLPPAFIATGDLDLFLDENIGYAQRLLRAGVPTELHVYPGAIHGFDLFAPNSRVAGQLVRDRDDALRRAFGAP
jgi:acetyl esterase/lipase